MASILRDPLRAAAAMNNAWVIRWTGTTIGDCRQCCQRVARATNNPGINAFSDGKSSGKAAHSSVNELEIFPNPVSSQITVCSLEKATKYEVYNLKCELLKTSSQNIIGIEDLPSGSYVLKAYFGENITSKQFIKME